MTSQRESRSYECALNPALHGCETFDFAPTDLPALRRRLQAYDGFSVHAPLPTPPGYPGRATTSFLLDADPARRQASLDALEETIRTASEWGAQYVVVHFGGLSSVSAGDFQRLLDEISFEASGRLLNGKRLHRTGGLEGFLGQFSGSNITSRGEQKRPFYGIFKFSDIPRPVILHEERSRFRRKPLNVFFQLFVELVNEIAYEQGDITPPFS